MKLFSSVSLNSVALGGFALIAASLLASVNELTRGPIAKAERAAAQRALLEILPADTHDNNLLEDTLPLSAQWQQQLQSAPDAVIYRARRAGKIVGAIIPVTANDGYSGKIKLLVGINRDLTVNGVRVLSHNETPGLGDKVETKKSNWILSFNGKSLGNPHTDKWAVKKDGGAFDQFTGATITPRAVVKQVKQALEFAHQNRNALFAIERNDHEH